MTSFKQKHLNELFITYTVMCNLNYFIYLLSSHGYFTYTN